MAFEGRNGDERYPTTSEDFRRSQNDRTTNVQIQRGAKKTTRKVVGTAMQVAGTTAAVAGKGAEVAGRAISRIPVVGAIPGGALMGAGRATRVGGKVTNRAGKKLRRSGNASRRSRTNDKSKIRRAVMWSASVLFVMWMYQLLFWIIAMIGLGLDGNAISYKDFGLSLPQRIGARVTGALVDGETLFMAGWVLSSLMGLAGLFTAMGICIFRGINIFKRRSLIALGVVFAFTLAPLGIIPWSLVWMWILYRN